jgi:hypothetical protein
MFYWRRKMLISEHLHAIKIPFQIPVAPGKALDRFVYSYPVYETEIYLIARSFMSHMGILDRQDLKVL